MKTEEVTADEYRAALAAASRGRMPRVKRLPPDALPRPAATDAATDWTQGKALRALAMGWQIGYNAAQLPFAFRGDERRGPFASVALLLRELEGEL